MKTIKIHKIFTKASTDPWIINLKSRLSDTIDAKDPKIQLNSLFSEKQISTIAIPFTQLTINYIGYVGYDREYINDNTIDFYNVFQINDDIDSETFTIEYFNFINTNPISLSWFDLVSTLNPYQYSLNKVLEDETGNIIPL